MKLNKIKKIKIINNNKNNIYYFIENYELINIIKPNNILLIELYNINYYYVELKYNTTKYNLEYMINRINYDGKIRFLKYIYNSILSLHRMNIIHGNIKTSNFLISDNGHLYSTDYCLNIIRNIESSKEADIYNIGIVVNKLFNFSFSKNNAKHSHLSNQLLYNQYHSINRKNSMSITLLLLDNDVRGENPIDVINKIIQSYELYNNKPKCMLEIIKCEWLYNSNDLRDIITYKLNEIPFKIDEVEYLHNPYSLTLKCILYYFYSY